jgi:tetratricopeptide (TPR) repeat protein
LARTDAESERNVAQQATIAADVQRNIAQQALADTEIERNKAQKALADYESEHSRADQAVADVKSESSRAEQAAAGLQTESERAEQGAAAAKAESERAAQEAADLINAAPDIFAAARTLLSRGDINAALEKIGMAIKLDETNPDYRLLRANLLETTQDLAGATDEYRRVLALRPDDPTATANLDLCGQLLDAKGDDPALNLDLRKQLLAALRNQNRTDEAAFLSNQIDPLGVATRKEILKRLKNFTILPNWKDTDLVRASDGTFSINFSGLNLAGIAGLKLDGLPISRINMGGSQGSDLTPLKNLKLNSLILENCQQVSDISPLRGQPLKSIELCGTMVRDLSPLMDSPTLEEIGLPNVPLKSMPPEVLKWLEHLPHLKRISYGYDNNHASQSATEFWQSQGITP